MLIRHGVSILLDESFHLVGHIQGVMGDRESSLSKSRLLEDGLVLRFDQLSV